MVLNEKSRGVMFLDYLIESPDNIFLTCHFFVAKTLYFAVLVMCPM